MNGGWMSSERSFEKVPTKKLFNFSNIMKNGVKWFSWHKGKEISKKKITRMRMEAAEDEPKMMIKQHRRCIRLIHIHQYPCNTDLNSSHTTDIFTHACPGYLPVNCCNVWDCECRSTGAPSRTITHERHGTTSLEYSYFEKQLSGLLLTRFFVQRCCDFQRSKETGACVPSRFRLIMRTMHVRG